MKQDRILSVFGKIRQRLQTTAGRIAGRENADDVLQDAFCKLWTMKNMPTSQEHAEGVATTIVKNISINYKRVADRIDQTQWEHLEPNAPQSHETLEQFNTVKRIIEQQLNEIQCQVLWMRDYEGYSFEEIAERMQITEDNARQILSRARKIVRETYKRIN